MKPTLQNFDVSCAIIEKDGLILAAQRNEAMNMPLKWEFPGGKVEPDESAATCLQREIREELGVEIRIKGIMSLSNQFSYQPVHSRTHSTGPVFAWRHIFLLRMANCLSNEGA